MAPPRSKQEVFMIISNRFTEQDILCKKLPERRAWTKNQLASASAKFPFMQSDNLRSEYSKWRLNYLLNKPTNQPILVTTKSFFKVAYEHRPSVNANNDDSPLPNIMTRGYFEHIVIGRLDGKHLLHLLPASHSVPKANELNVIHEKLRHAPTDGHHISYGHRHPSEEYTPIEETAAQAYRGQPDLDFRTTPQDEPNKLFRAFGLGWVILVNEHTKAHEYTGHALVMDVDRGRDHHPWFVLSRRVPQDEEDAKGNFYVNVPEHVYRDDTDELGVLPGNRNRTPVGKIIPLPTSSSSSSKLPVLQRLGPDFHFKILRAGNPTWLRKDSNRGPPLARILIPYWDPTTKEEVCYNDDGTEYARFHRQSGSYRYILDPQAWARQMRTTAGGGQQAPPPSSSSSSSGPVSLQQRLTNQPQSFPAPPPRPRKTTTGTYESL